MAASVLGLSDAEIDKLLAEAESRLANPDSSNAVAAPQQDAAVAPAAQTPVVVAAPSAAPAEVVKPTLDNKPKKLSVRVPQSKEKNKVRSTVLNNSHHTFHDENLPHFFMTQFGAPSWGRRLHHNDSFMFIVTLTGHHSFSSVTALQLLRTSLLTRETGTQD